MKAKTTVPAPTNSVEPQESSCFYDLTRFKSEIHWKIALGAPRLPFWYLKWQSRETKTRLIDSLNFYVPVCFLAPMEKKKSGAGHFRNVSFSTSLLKQNTEKKSLFLQPNASYPNQTRVTTRWKEKEGGNECFWSKK